VSDLQTRVHVSGGDVTFESIQDCTPALEHAQRLHNEGHHGSSEMRYAAHFPAVIVEAYCNIKGVTFHEFMQRKEGHINAMLNDPDLSGFRIWKGKV
jgi:hypothetical protein